MTAASAQLTVSRNMSNDMGIREVYIYLDGEMIATLRNKESVTRDISSGHHALRAFNTLVSKTVEFDVQPGERVRFTTSNRSGCGSFLIFLLGAGPLYVSLVREDESPPA
jgi:hypothetical protein